MLWTVPAARARARPVEEHPLRPWRLPIGWWLGLFFGVQSTAFYATLAWLPSMLQARGFGEREAGLLLALCSVVSFVPAFVLPVLAARRRDQRGAARGRRRGAGGRAARAGRRARRRRGWVALIGAGQGAALGLALILPGLRAGDPRLVGPLMGMAQCIGYTMAACGPWLLGVVRDLTGGWTAPLYVLLAITALELPAGLVAARGRGAARARRSRRSRDGVTSTPPYAVTICGRSGASRVPISAITSVDTPRWRSVATRWPTARSNAASVMPRPAWASRMPRPR